MLALSPAGRYSLHRFAHHAATALLECNFMIRRFFYAAMCGLLGNSAYGDDIAEYFGVAQAEFHYDEAYGGWRDPSPSDAPAPEPVAQPQASIGCGDCVRATVKQPQVVKRPVVQQKASRRPNSWAARRPSVK